MIVLFFRYLASFKSSDKLSLASFEVRKSYPVMRKSSLTSTLLPDEAIRSSTGRLGTNEATTSTTESSDFSEAALTLSPVTTFAIIASILIICNMYSKPVITKRQPKTQGNPRLNYNS